jgi:two-component system chemotaxis sensor kinase CheA
VSERDEVEPGKTHPDVSVVIPSPHGVPAEGQAPPVGQLLVERGAIGPDAVTLAVMQQGEGDGRRIGEILVAHGSTTAAHVVDALETQAETKRSTADSSVRVEAELLDALQRCVAELARVRDDIVSGAAAGVASDKTSEVRRLDVVTRELQACVRRARSQPVSTAWSALGRVARARADACGKDVRLETHGGEVELDRATLDTVRDALAVFVSRAVDHGVESAQARLACGKPAEGQLVVQATYESGSVVVEVSDDGCGSVTSAEEGLDAARTDVEQLGGRVDVDSTPGRGTTIRITVPRSSAPTD